MSVPDDLRDYRDTGGYYNEDNGTLVRLDVNARLHRLGGLPARINPDGSYEWWVEGKQYPSGDDDDYKKACDDYLQKYGIFVPGRLTKRASPST